MDSKDGTQSETQIRSSELVVLRREQSERVMPMIGGLLDAWDQLSNDMKHDDELTSVREYIERIDAAMEGQQHNSVLGDPCKE